MVKKVKVTESINVRLPVRLKRRLKDISSDRGISMNDIIVTAVKNYVDDADMSYSAPDLILDRMNEILMSNMNMVNAINRLGDKIDER